MQRRGHLLFTLALLAPAALAVAAAFPAVLRIPRAGSPDAPRTPPEALFSHRTHGTFGCYACHPSVFPEAPLGFTHQQMREGRFCGHCHDGAHASAVETKLCGACHAPLP
jgi:c(7)-type cytochrome triheme protein